MITNFEEETGDLSPKEHELMLVIAEGLKTKIGKNQAITATAIISAFKKREIKIDPARLRKIINHIRIHNVIPCLISSSRGYYISVDDQEINDYRKSLKERATSILALEEAIQIQQVRRVKQNSMF